MSETFKITARRLVVAFNNALQVDRGIVDKQKVIRKRELYDEIPDEEDIDEIDVKDEEEVLPPEARGFEPPKEEQLTKADIRLYTHPHFDWNAKHTWQNDPKAVQYWLRYIKPKKEDDEFTKKTY